MKVSVDGIISTAKRMNSKIQTDEQSVGKKGKELKSDSIEIRKKINSRLILMQDELKAIQSSLTRNQIIKDGIFQLKEDRAEGFDNQNGILNGVRFEDEKVLYKFVEDSDLEGDLNLKINEIDDLIDLDISKLKRLQIEVENILASNLADSEVEAIRRNIETALSEIDYSSISSISNLSGDTVMSLIK
ncbi:MAG: hypothetical protein SVZ03_13915 [Spirochaetota bacterium]|nr:hypothetical protein [Spirochaetota bacterium]